MHVGVTTSKGDRYHIKLCIVYEHCIVLCVIYIHLHLAGGRGSANRSDGWPGGHVYI